MLSTWMVATAVWGGGRWQLWWRFPYLVLNTWSEGCFPAEEVRVGLWNCWSSWQVLAGKAIQAVPETETRVWEEFGEAMEDCPEPQEGEAVPCQHCLQCGRGAVASTGDTVWRWKVKFEDLLNPTDMPYIEEAQAGTRRWTRLSPEYWGGLQPSLKRLGEDHMFHGSTPEKGGLSSLCW